MTVLVAVYRPYPAKESQGGIGGREGGKRERERLLRYGTRTGTKGGKRRKKKER